MEPPIERGNNDYFSILIVDRYCLSLQYPVLIRQTKKHIKKFCIHDHENYGEGHEHWLSTNET